MGRDMSSSKKRKRETKAPSVPVPDGLDLISQLPDCILHSILSLLPVKDAARTSVLSSRRRRLWKAASLRLDDNSFYPINHKHHVDDCYSDPRFDSSRKAVISIFNSHHGPIESLRLSLFYPFELYNFVETAVQRGIRELKLVPLKFIRDHDTYKLPLFLLFCNTLHQLSLQECIFPELLPPSIFPNLRELRIKIVWLPDDFLSKCASLETLLISTYYKGPPISISSRSLRKLVLDLESEAEFIIKDAPNLESLMLTDEATIYCKLKVLDAPKLQQLGFINANKYEGNGDVCYLDVGMWEEQGSLSFLDHLKTVTVKGFWGDQCDVELLRYLVVHGKVLQTITLLCSKNITKKFVDIKKRQICIERRASSNLALFFFRDTERNVHFSLWNDMICY
ncbi:hypothetical protein LUZ61_005709 [Rhynchospora tenuis]|uniref:F-box domain-containing protein n=1 Tax=Rhynchospora tenuis TaxID=198213 RepID=A0AAD5ZQ44_9POAL|nr:hypothetical protein LUZ61_005709 [Rhynchospora tenuis]